MESELLTTGVAAHYQSLNDYPKTTRMFLFCNDSLRNAMKIQQETYVTNM